MNGILEQALRRLEVAGTVSRLPSHVSDDFEHHLSKKYPWTVSRVDWSKVDRSFTYDLGNINDDQLLELLQKSTLSAYEHTGLIYGSHIKGVQIPSTRLVEHFDDLTFPLQHVYFFGVGVEVNDTPIHYFDDFLELYHMKLSTITRD